MNYLNSNLAPVKLLKMPMIIGSIMLFIEINFPWVTKHLIQFKDLIVNCATKLIMNFN